MWSGSMNQRSERRRSKRYQVRLLSSISLIDQKSGHRQEGSPMAVLARTLDISLDGLALTIPPSDIINTPDLNVPGHELQVWLALPDGKQIEMKVTLIWPAKFARNLDEIGYLIGVQIKEMSPMARAHYNEFISSLDS